MVAVEPWQAPDALHGDFRFAIPWCVDFPDPEPCVR